MNKKERNALAAQRRKEALKAADLIRLEVWLKSTDHAAIAQVKGLDQRHTVKGQGMATKEDIYKRVEAYGAEIDHVKIYNNDADLYGKFDLKLLEMIIDCMKREKG